MPRFRDSSEFGPTLDAAAERLGISPTAVEKDYWMLSATPRFRRGRFASDRLAGSSTCEQVEEFAGDPPAAGAAGLCMISRRGSAEDAPSGQRIERGAGCLLADSGEGCGAGDVESWVCGEVRDEPVSGSIGTYAHQAMWPGGGELEDGREDGLGTAGSLLDGAGEPPDPRFGAFLAVSGEAGEVTTTVA